jgi:hypothetical protein
MVNLTSTLTTGSLIKESSELLWLTANTIYRNVPNFPKWVYKDSWLVTHQKICLPLALAVVFDVCGI